MPDRFSMISIVCQSPCTRASAKEMLRARFSAQMFCFLCGLGDDTHHIGCTLLQIRQGDGVAVYRRSGLNRANNVIHILLAAGHLNVISSKYAARGSRDGINRLMIPLYEGLFLGGKPVCHDDTPESPFVPRQRLKQIIAVGGMNAIEQVIGCHDRQRLRFPDGNLKAFQIDLPQCALSNVRIGEIPILFLGISGKVLDCRTLAGMPLHAPCDAARPLITGSSE